MVGPNEYFFLCGSRVALNDLQRSFSGQQILVRKGRFIRCVNQDSRRKFCELNFDFYAILFARQALLVDVVLIKFDATFAFIKENISRLQESRLTNIVSTHQYA